MATNQVFPFLNLPAELRNQFYADLLFQETPIQVVKLGVRTPPLDVFAVCKQVAKEARAVFWGENTFQISVIDFNFDGIADWLHGIGKASASLIRKLLIQYKHSVFMENAVSTRLIDETDIEYGSIESEIQGHTVTFFQRDRDLVDRMRHVFKELGLPRKSLFVVPPGTTVEHTLFVSSDTDIVLTAMHLVFNQKMVQLSQATDVDEDGAESVVELEGWKVQMIC